MNDLINKYNRICAILSCLNVDYRNNNNFDRKKTAKSVAQLEEELCVPREQLRQDLMFLMASPVFRTWIDSDGAGDTDGADTIVSDDLIDLFDQQSEGWDTLPINFHFDDIYSSDELLSTILSASDEYSTAKQQLPVYMSVTERELFRRYVPRYKKENWNTLLFKYPPFSQINPETHNNRKDAGKAFIKNEQLNHNREEIAKAIRFEKRINFVYQDKTNTLAEMTIRPLRILESLDNGLLYIISSPDDKNITLHRLDRIHSSVKLVKDTIDECPASGQCEADAPVLETPLQKFDFIWDADAAYDNEPFDVRIRVKANTRNILDKIKNETSRRKYASLTQSETESGIWYYTDTVIGFDSFRRWVFQYGASMTVLEPQKLADSIYQSALRKLKFYDKGKFER